MLASDELFYYSVYYRVIIGIFLIFAGLVIGTLDLINPNPVYSLIIPITSFGGGLFLLYQALSSRVWSADFFENIFEVRAWHFNKTFSYADIEDVALVSTPWPNPNLSVSINVKGENKSLTITKNPTNRELAADLYSWLREKKLGKNAESLDTSDPHDV